MQLYNYVILTRYLLVECNEDKDTKEGSMYLNVMRRFSQALMKVGLYVVLLSPIRSIGL